MGRLVVAGLVGLAAAGAAQAQDRVAVQRPGASYPPPPTVIAAPPPPSRPSAPARPTWGSKIDGRWWGGLNAPGGYAAYRRPVRGYVLPAYWNAPRFYVDDWAAYALPQPPVGYRWVRYYDDAVLIDGRGAVYDSEAGVDWDRIERAPAYAAAPTPPPPPPYVAPPRRDTGLGGAAIGAVAGGALGAAVAGRGDRLGGALIGGGVGAVTGYAIDRAEDRGRVPPPPPPGYGAGYPPPPGYYDPAYGYGYPPPPTVQTYTIPAGATQTVCGGPGVTTVTVTTQPATTTEYVDEVVTYTRPAARPVYRTKLVRRGKTLRR